MREVEKIFVRPSESIEDTIGIINRGSVGIALVVEDDRRLLGTITDGDVRRAIIKKVPLDSEIRVLLGSEFRAADLARSLTAQVGIVRDQLLAVMRARDIRHIPLLDGLGRVVELALLSELVEEDPSMRLTAVVMAGGEGQRLRPLTEHMPKPMLPLNNRPLMERTIEQLKRSGVRKVAIATHYKSDIIANHFGDGKNFGVDIDYITEERPLGTAGALGLMAPPEGPTLIINGDIVTQLDFRSMHDFHRTHQAVMTVGVRVYELKIPYGVIHADDILITQLVEKPVQSVVVNAGIYLLEPAAFGFIPRGSSFHMTDLITRLLREGQRVIRFPIQEYWLDVGEHAEYLKANEDAKNGHL